MKKSLIWTGAIFSFAGVDTMENTRALVSAIVKSRIAILVDVEKSRLIRQVGKKGVRAALTTKSTVVLLYETGTAHSYDVRTGIHRGRIGGRSITNIGAIAEIIVISYESNAWKRYDAVSRQPIRGHMKHTSLEAKLVNYCV